MKPEVRKIRELNRWRRIKRNGSLNKKTKQIIAQTNNVTEINNVTETLWMHDYAKNNPESIDVVLDESGIFSAGDKNNSVNIVDSVNTESESNSQSMQPSDDQPTDNEIFISGVNGVDSIRSERYSHITSNSETEPSTFRDSNRRNVLGRLRRRT